MTTIITKNSSTASAVPSAGSLVQGELAVNVTDKKIYTKDATAAIVKVVGSLGNQEANAVAITGGSITGMSAPTNSSDVSNKGYVDGLISTGAANAAAAAASASAAATSATNAATSASSASTSASSASTSASAASTAQTAAESARDATLAAYDSFDDRYLGTKTSDPTVDNDGNALIAGALYFNSVDGIMKLYTGSAWVAAYVSGAGYAALASANTFTNSQTISANTSSNALRITQTGAGNALLVEDAANPDSTPFVIDTNGKLKNGYLTDWSGLSIPRVGIDANSSSAFATTSFGYNTSAPIFASVVGGGTTFGDNALVVSGQNLGRYRWYGTDGTAPILAASIEAYVDGTPGTNDMPGRLVFSTTADGAATPTERMRISNAGTVTFKNDYIETVVTANTSTAYTIDLANGTVQILTLTGNCTFTFPTATAGKSFIMLLKQDATGSRTVTWPAAVKWPSGTAPTITATASKTDKYVFTADGTYWVGSTAGQNYTL